MTVTGFGYVSPHSKMSGTKIHTVSELTSTWEAESMRDDVPAARRAELRQVLRAIRDKNDIDERIGRDELTRHRLTVQITRFQDGEPTLPEATPTTGEPPVAAWRTELKFLDRRLDATKSKPVVADLSKRRAEVAHKVGLIDERARLAARMKADGARLVEIDRELGAICAPVPMSAPPVPIHKPGPRQPRPAGARQL